MAFEEFTAKTSGNLKAPMVSILKHGRIGLNGECYRKYFNGYKYVIFFYDKENNKMGMRPTNQPQSNASNIKVSRKGNLANISALTFLKHYNIPFDQSRSYPCHRNETDDLVEVQL